MGCDIHTFVELFDARWQLTQPEFPCTWCGGEKKDRVCYWCGDTGVCRRFDARNYSLFAMLADVRNYGGVKPIARPRGWPDDLSGGLRALLNETSECAAEDDSTCGAGWGPGQPGDHSESWLTVAEIERYFETAPNVAMKGCVPIEHFAEWPENWYRGDKGLSYWRDVFGPNIVKLNETQARSMLAGDIPREEGKSYYVAAAWPASARAEAGESFFQFLAACRALSSNAEHVRLVFNFDS